MATATRHLSYYDPKGVPNGKGMRIALVISEWNREITDSLREGARATLIENGVLAKDISEAWVPGSFELAGGAQFVLRDKKIDGVVCIGSIVKGETPHFDFVCQATAQGIMTVGLAHAKPVIFCVLTDNSMQQARDRSGGRHGNKGVDCAVACLKMVALGKRTSKR